MTHKHKTILLLCLLNFTYAHAVEFGVYGGVTLIHDEVDSRTNYQLDALDLFASQEVGKKTEAFIELAFEDTGSGIIADVERFWINYAISDLLKIGAGRFHSPMGFWNHNYHHGSFLQDTVSRPFFLEFEDGDTAIMPAHSVGLKGNLHFKALNGDVNFDIIGGNGSSLNDNKEILIYNKAPEHRIKTSIASRFSYSHSTRFTSGLSFLNNQFTAENLTGSSPGDYIFGQQVAALDVKFDMKLFYILTEYYFLKIKNEIAQTDTNANAWYVQFGFRHKNKYILTLRHAQLDTELADAYFNLLLDNNSENISYQTITARYNLNESSSIKIEIQNADDITNYALQWAFLLF